MRACSCLPLLPFGVHRFVHHVDNMPGDLSVIAPLSSRVQKRILRRAVRDSDPTVFLTQHTDAVRAIVREVRDSYVFAVKHSIVGYKLLSPSGRERFQGLRIAIPTKTVVKREFGMVRFSCMCVVATPARSFD